MLAIRRLAWSVVSKSSFNEGFSGIQNCLRVGMGFVVDVHELADGGVGIFLRGGE
jgi:hypothetical protein